MPFFQALCYRLIEFQAWNHFMAIMLIDTLLTADKIGVNHGLTGYHIADNVRYLSTRLQTRPNARLWTCLDIA